MRWVQLCTSLSIGWHCLSLELAWKLNFSSPVATAKFSTFTSILSAGVSQHHFFRIWNISTGIPSPPLALLVVMLPKVHLTSHSRMSGSRWVITWSWLSGSWGSFLYSSSVYSYHLFLISSASVRSIPFLSFIVPIFAWKVPLVSVIFLKRPLVCPILLFSPISLHFYFYNQYLWGPEASRDSPNFTWTQWGSTWAEGALAGRKALDSHN